MSENIIIQEGGVGKQLVVDKLKTDHVGGGSCLWVPEDSVQLTTKHITENGTYRASTDGYYGYSEATVSIPNVGTATGTDSDGDEAVAYTDPETGELETDKVPSSIKVITPPTNPYGIYKDGQTINTDGMVAKAYYKTGGEYGTVPNGEVTLNPTTAIYDESTDIPGGEQVETDLDLSPITSPFNSGYTEVDHRFTTAEILHLYTAIGGVIAIFRGDNGYYNIVYAGSSPFSYRKTVIEYGKPVGSSEYNVTTQYTLDNKTVYYSANLGLGGTVNPSGNNVNGSFPSTKIDKIAWAMIYGTKTPIQAGSRQQITVSWPRPLDSKVLETTFEILVAPPIYGGGDD